MKFLTSFIYMLHGLYLNSSIYYKGHWKTLSYICISIASLPLIFSSYHTAQEYVLCLQPLLDVVFKNSHTTLFAFPAPAFCTKSGTQQIQITFCDKSIRNVFYKTHVPLLNSMLRQLKWQFHVLQKRVTYWMHCVPKLGETLFLPEIHFLFLSYFQFCQEKNTSDSLCTKSYNPLSCLFGLVHVGEPTGLGTGKHMHWKLSPFKSAFLKTVTLSGFHQPCKCILYSIGMVGFYLTFSRLVAHRYRAMLYALIFLMLQLMCNKMNEDEGKDKEGMELVFHSQFHI